MNAVPRIDLKLSADQQHAHDAVAAWYRSHQSDLITLGGFAGSGKTFLTSQIVGTLRQDKPKIRIAFCCFTGKAALVLKEKLNKAEALNGDYCGTIHSLIYAPNVDENTGKVISWDKAPTLPADLIIVDEASMLDAEVYADLKSYGVPIFAVGDHGQLPPVTGTFNLMKDPNLRLEKIHRQAEGNPIIRASMIVRETGKIPQDELATDEGSMRTTYDHNDIFNLPDLMEVMVICGTNRTRTGMNWLMRQKLGFTFPEPTAGEKVICLKNNRREEIYNGMLGRLKEIYTSGTHHYGAEISFDGGQNFSGRILKHQFGAALPLKGTEVQGLHHKQYRELFDWGYCLTCHKAQGSQADVVALIDECDWMKDEDMRRRWRYTAVTRAAKHLLVVKR